MNVTTTHVGPVVVLRVQEARLTYPILADFATETGYTIPGLSVVAVGHQSGMSSPCSDSGRGPK